MVARGLLIFAALSGFIAVSLGAFGAHALKASLSDYHLGIYQTAVSYQFYHTSALLFIALLHASLSSRWLTWAGVSMAAGVTVFSGSLYVLALTQQSWLGMLTPVGGLLLLIGWLLLALTGYQSVRRK